MPDFKCPSCEGKKLLVYSVAAIWLNTDEHYCHSVKSYDKNAKVVCDDCNWQGDRKQVEEWYENNN